MTNANTNSTWITDGVGKTQYSSRYTGGGSSIYISVKDAPYNAVGNGVTDDTAAIQSAITAAGVNGTIVLPNATYKVLGTLVMLSGQMMIGFSATLTGNASNFYMISSNDGNVFEGIKFVTHDTAIFINGKDKVVIERCRFDTGNNPVYFNGGTNGRVSNSFFNNVAVSSVVIDNDAKNIKIEGNTMTNPSQFGGYGSGQNSAHVYVLSGTEVFVIDNHITNSGGQGIGFAYNSTLGKGSVRCKAIGNHCEGNGQEGITSYGGNSKLSYDNVISGNTSRNNRFHQIEVWQSDRCVVTGNIVEESATTYGNIGAITIYQSEHITVTSNTVKQATNNGIGIIALSKKCVISSNTIKNTNMQNSATVTNGQGILLDSSGVGHPTEIAIFGNILESTNGFTAAKSGVYSTSNTNKNNKISAIQAFGYQYVIHEFAYLTCSNYASAVPSSGTWFQSDVVYNIYPSELGASSSKYVIIGWICTVTGTPGTWVAQRVLTGN